MSHGGFGGHGHGGHAVHHGHHTGHHTFGLGGQVIDASLCLDLLQGVFVSLFPSLKSHPWFKKKQYDPLDPEVASQTRENSDWENALQPPTLKQKLMHMDLRPFVLLGIFIGGLCLYSVLIYWLRHNDDPTGKTFNKFKTKDALMATDGRGMGQQSAPAAVSESGQQEMGEEGQLSQQGQLPQQGYLQPAQSAGYSVPAGGYAQLPQQPMPAQAVPYRNTGGYMQNAVSNGYAQVQQSASYNQMPAAVNTWSGQTPYAGMAQNGYGTTMPQQGLQGQAGGGWQPYDPRYRSAGVYPAQGAYPQQGAVYAGGPQPGAYGGMQGTAQPTRHRVVVTR